MATADSFEFVSEIKRAMNAFASYLAKHCPYRTEVAYLQPPVYLFNYVNLSDSAEGAIVYIFDSSSLTPHLMNLLSMVNVRNQGLVWPCLLHSVHEDTGLFWVMRRVASLGQCFEYCSSDGPAPRVWCEIDVTFHHIFRYILESVFGTTPFSTKLKCVRSTISGMCDHQDSSFEIQDQPLEVNVTMVIHNVGDCIMNLCWRSTVEDCVVSDSGFVCRTNTFGLESPLLKAALICLLGQGSCTANTHISNFFIVKELSKAEIIDGYQLEHHHIVKAESQFLKHLLCNPPKVASPAIEGPSRSLESVITVKDEVIDNVVAPKSLRKFGFPYVRYCKRNASVKSSKSEQDGHSGFSERRVKSGTNSVCTNRYFMQVQRCPFCCASFKRGCEEESYLIHHAKKCHPEICPGILSVIRKKYPH